MHSLYAYSYAYAQKKKGERWGGRKRKALEYKEYSIFLRAYYLFLSKNDDFYVVFLISAAGMSHVNNSDQTFPLPGEILSLSDTSLDPCMATI